jgi:hypothetical protein
MEKKMDKTIPQSKLLSYITFLLFAHLLVNLYSIFVQDANAGTTVDCRIVDINTSDKLKVEISDIDTNEALKVKMDQYGHSSSALQVKIVDWLENDPIKVKTVQ